MHDCGGRIGDQLGEKRRLATLAGRAQTDGDEQRQSFQPARQIPQPTQGGGVAPMEIVDRQQRRAPRGDVGHEPVEPMQDRERHVARSCRRSSDLR